MQYVSHSAHLNSRRLSPKQYPSTENYRNGVRPQRYVLCSKCKRLNSGSRELVYSTKELDGFRFCRRFNDSPRSHFSSPTIIEKLLKGELNGLKKKKKNSCKTPFTVSVPCDLLQKRVPELKTYSRLSMEV